MAVNVTRDFLIANGVLPETLDRLVAESTVRDVAAALARDAGGRPVRPGPGPPVLAAISVGDGWWEASVGRWHPVSDNLRARGVRAWSRGKARDREVIREMLCVQARIPPATGRRLVSLVVIKRNCRGVRDSANLLKSLHDGLKTCGMLVDDDERWLDWERPRIAVDRSQEWPVRSVIRLEAVEARDARTQ